MLQIPCKSGRCNDLRYDGKASRGPGRKDATAKMFLPHLQFSRTGRTAAVGTRLPGNRVSPPTSAQRLYHKPRGLGQTTQTRTGGCSFHFCPSSSLPAGKGCTVYQSVFHCQSLAKNLSAPAASPVPRIALLPSSEASSQLRAHTHAPCGVPVPAVGRERCPPPLPQHGSTEPPATTIISA